MKWLNISLGNCAAFGSIKLWKWHVLSGNFPSSGCIGKSPTTRAILQCWRFDFVYGFHWNIYISWNIIHWKCPCSPPFYGSLSKGIDLSKILPRFGLAARLKGGPRLYTTLHDSEHCFWRKFSSHSWGQPFELDFWENASFLFLSSGENAARRYFTFMSVKMVRSVKFGQWPLNLWLTSRISSGSLDWPLECPLQSCPDRWHPRFQLRWAFLANSCQELHRCVVELTMINLLIDKLISEQWNGVWKILPLKFYSFA